MRVVLGARCPCRGGRTTPWSRRQSCWARDGRTAPQCRTREGRPFGPIDVHPFDKQEAGAVCGCTWTLSAGCLRLLTRCIGHGWAAQRALGSPGVGDHAIEHTQHTDWQIELDPCPVHVKHEGPVARVSIETRPSTVHADYDYGEWVDLSHTDLPLAILDGCPLAYSKHWVSVARPT